MTVGYSTLPSPVRFFYLKAGLLFFLLDSLIIGSVSPFSGGAGRVASRSEPSYPHYFSLSVLLSIHHRILSYLLKKSARVRPPMHLSNMKISKVILDSAPTHLRLSFWLPPARRLWSRFLMLFKDFHFLPASFLRSPPPFFFPQVFLCPLSVVL